MNQEQVLLNELTSQVRNCRECVLRKRCKQVVPGVGSPYADVVFVGQAPGWQEDRDGIPWIGQAGQFLTRAFGGVAERFQIMDGAPLRAYHTNLVKCFPGRRKGGDAEPPVFAQEACRHWLRSELELIKPKLIVAVGAISMRALGVKGGINKNAGRVFETEYGRVMPVLHPAGLMRNTRATADFVTSLNAIATQIRGPLPPPERSGHIKFAPLMAVDVETDGIARSKDGTLYTVGLSENGSRTALLWEGGGKALMADYHRRGLVPVMHHARYDLEWLERDLGVTFKDWRDTLLEAHFLGYAPKGLKSLTPVFLGAELHEYQEVVPKGTKIWDAPVEKVLDYNAMDAWATKKLHDLWEPAMRRHTDLYALERKLTRVIMGMEKRGLPLNQPKLKLARRDVLRRMGALEAQLAAAGIPEPNNREAVGRKFWKNKPDIVTTKTGELATGAKVLRDHCRPGEVPWVEAFIEYQTLSKFKSTYLDTWAGQDYIHASFNQAGTANWRWSCSNPNLQNIPKSASVPLYTLFEAPEGWHFITADASQVELRDLANESGDEAMQSVFLDGRDLHQETQDAIAKLGVFERYHIEEVKHRVFAKTVNFGIPYGITEYGLAGRLGIPKPVAKAFIDAFYQAYPGVAPRQDEWVMEAQDTGQVQTHAGRTLYLPGMLAEEGRLREHGEKQAKNFPISGGAQDIIKDALLRVEAAAPDRLACFVHDELLYLLPPDENPHEFAAFLGETLTDRRHRVPYTWDIAVGTNWGEIKHIPEKWIEEEDDD